MPRILVTGGAGYVGSHCARRLLDTGAELVVLDDLSTGHAEAAVAPLIRMDLRDPALADVLATGFDAVLHFAALTAVGESVREPLRYWDVNVGGTLNLLRAMNGSGCRRLVFSSSCAVYGIPERVPIDEDCAFRPISPYGSTKAAVDRLLTELRTTGALHSFALRYFNAAGAAEDGALGESHDPETHLIPLALHAAAKGRPFHILGTDHATADGTCVRDYVHVEDLAEAHAKALALLLDGDPGDAVNLGSGAGASVAEVLGVVERVTGRPIDQRPSPARAGDPPTLVTAPGRASSRLGWQPTRNIETCVRHAWRWYQRPRW